jgi:BASS family bile acid:Na+ symporter
VQTGFLTTGLLPIALGVIMLGLGLGLKIADFKRVVVFPKAVLVGLACQMLVLPVVCFLIARGFGLEPPLAVGLMLLAASPGGATANIYSHLAKGDVALNITLTAVNSVLSLFTLPLIVNYSLEKFMGEGRALPLHFKDVVQVFAIVLIPVGIGMIIHANKPALAKALDKPVKILSAVFLVLVIAAAVVKERANLATYFAQVGLAALAFNVASLLTGYFIPRLARLKKKQATAIGMEIGIHNGTLAIAIATNLLKDTRMAMPAAIYSLIMFVTAALFGFIVNRVGNEPGDGKTGRSET